MDGVLCLFAPLWLLCGLLAAYIYSSNGSPAFGGFLAGAILGPIGVLLALLTTPNADAIQQKQITSGGMKKCPHCAETIRVDANVCRYCGRDLPTTTAAASSGQR